MLAITLASWLLHRSVHAMLAYCGVAPDVTEARSMHRFGRSLLSVGRQRKYDRVGGLAPLGAALCWRTTGSLPVAEVPCTTTMRMEIAGVPGVFGFLLCRPWSFAGIDITMQ